MIYQNLIHDLTRSLNDIKSTDTVTAEGMKKVYGAETKALSEQVEEQKKRAERLEDSLKDAQGTDTEHKLKAKT